MNMMLYDRLTDRLDKIEALLDDLCVVRVGWKVEQERAVMNAASRRIWLRGSGIQDRAHNQSRLEHLYAKRDEIDRKIRELT